MIFKPSLLCLAFPYVYPPFLHKEQILYTVQGVRQLDRCVIYDSDKTKVNMIIFGEKERGFYTVLCVGVGGRLLLDKQILVLLGSTEFL